MKKIIITLHKNEILFDIENAAHIVGRDRSTGDNFEQVHNIQNTGAGEDREFILRSIETAFNESKRLLGRYIKTENQAANNIPINESGDFVMELYHANMFNESATDNLKDAIHEYIVSSSLFDWFSVAKPEEMPAYDARRQAAAISMLNAFFSRSAPARPYYPSYQMQQ